MDICEVNQPYIEHFPNHDHIYLNPNEQKTVIYLTSKSHSVPTGIARPKILQNTNGSYLIFAPAGGFFLRGKRAFPEKIVIITRGRVSEASER